MKLLLQRVALKDTYTIGRLSINSQYFCDTIEDKVRPIGEAKVFGQTAIPYGFYEITLAVQSPKYKTRKQYEFCNGYLPRLIDVPNFDGVLIHIGNTAADSAGCILVGKNDVKGRVSNSTATFEKLYEQLKTAASKGETITIEIV